MFDKYGKAIVNESYARESSLIESMLEDFSADTLSESIKALDGVAELIAALRAAQDEFNKANDSATAAPRARVIPPTQSKSRSSPQSTTASFRT